MADEPHEVLARVLKGARLTEKDMAKVAHVHPGTLSKFKNKQLKVEPIWVIQFMQRLQQALQRKSDALQHLLQESFEAWQNDPEIEGLLTMLQLSEASLTGHLETRLIEMEAGDEIPPRQLGVDDGKAGDDDT